MMVGVWFGTLIQWLLAEAGGLSHGKVLRWYLRSDVDHSNLWLGLEHDEVGRCRAKYQDLSVYAYLGMESWPLFTLNFYPVMESFTN
jgi:hypothetical protein